MRDEADRYSTSRRSEADSEALVKELTPYMIATPAQYQHKWRVGDVVICGFATEACVDTTVRSAWAKGFRVVLAAGAHTTTANAVLSAEQIVRHHDVVLARFARVVPAAEITFL